MTDDVFRHQTSSGRYDEPQTLAHSLQLAPAGWQQYVEAVHSLVESAKGRVWQCEPKFGRLAVGLELPEDVHHQLRDRINQVIRTAEASCEQCGGFGRLRDDREYWRTLCDRCAATDSP